MDSKVSGYVCTGILDLIPGMCGRGNFCIRKEKMCYMKASLHHRIFAIRSGSDGVEDYLENHLLGAFTTKSMKIESCSCTRKSVLLFSSFSSLFIFMYILLFLRILSEMTSPFVARTLAKCPKYVAYVVVGADQ